MLVNPCNLYSYCLSSYIQCHTWSRLVSIHACICHFMLHYCDLYRYGFSAAINVYRGFSYSCNGDESFISACTAEPFRCITDNANYAIAIECGPWSYIASITWIETLTQSVRSVLHTLFWLEQQHMLREYYCTIKFCMHVSSLSFVVN